MRLEFNEERHEYRLNGEIVPSVTQVLSSAIDFGNVPPDVLERKRQIGVALHYAIELRDDLDPSSLADEVVPYYSGWTKFLDEVKPTILGHEMRVASEIYRYAGTLDLHMNIGKKEALVDIKTTAMLHNAAALQTAAYTRAFAETYRVKRHLHRYALWLQPDGSYRLRPFDDPNDLPNFISFLNVHNWRVKNG